MQTLLLMILLLLAAPVFAQVTEFCSVFSGGTRTTGRIRVKALMTWSTVARVDGGDSYLYSGKCNNRDYFAVTKFSNLKTQAKLDKFLGSLADEKDFILEVDVTGQLVQSFIPHFGHLSWTRSAFKIDQIHSIVDISSQDNLIRPNYAIDAPLTNLARSLGTINADLIFLFLGSPSTPDTDGLIAGMIADDFSAIDPKGKTFGKASYRELKLFDDTKGYPSYFVRQPDRVTKTGNIYVVSGFMGIESAPRVKKQLRYENTYRVTDDSVYLVNSRFTKP